MNRKDKNPSLSIFLEWRSFWATCRRKVVNNLVETSIKHIYSLCLSWRSCESNSLFSLKSKNRKPKSKSMAGGASKLYYQKVVVFTKATSCFTCLVGFLFLNSKKHSLKAHLPKLLPPLSLTFWNYLLLFLGNFSSVKLVI